MTSFSSILSSLGEKPQSTQLNTTHARKESNAGLLPKAPVASDRFKLSAANSAAGVKRKAGDDSPTTAQDVGTQRSAASRFQLSSSSKSGGTISGRAGQTVGASDTAPRRPAIRQMSSREGKSLPTINAQRRHSNPASPTVTAVEARPSTPKKGFASILEKAKAAQAASQSVASGGIKHKPVERLSRKERTRINEELKAQQKQKSKPTGKPGNGESVKTSVPGGPSKVAPNISYKGTMKAAQRDVSYKSTMRAIEEGGSSARKPQKGLGQDKYGGYASWSDLDDADDGEEEEEDGYGSEDSDDMEGGFDDLQEEEATALREARREDQAALEEEERLQREKLARKRRLEQMNKAAASRKRY